MKSRWAGLVLGLAMGFFYGNGGSALAQAGAVKPLTNSDVVAMVKGRVPQESVLRLIGSRPEVFQVTASAKTQFLSDLANTPATETTAVWNAMLARAGSQPQGQGTGTPTPPGRAGTTRKLTPQQLATLTAKAHTAPGKPGPVATNPAATGGSMAILTALGQQRQTALVERGQTSPPAGAAPLPPSTSARLAMNRGVMTRAVPPPPSAPNRAVMAAQPNVMVACGTFNTPAISTVSGQQGGATFTQDPAYNPFTIKGCHFGNVRGQAQLNAGNGRQLATLTVDTWTDTLITVELNPALTDVLDQDNVTLVLFPVNGPQAQKPGLHFYAKRAEMFLTTIPASAAALAPITDDGGIPVPLKYSSPYPTSGGNASAGADRGNSTRFPGGSDVFDFSRLKPGFVVEKYQVNELSNAICPASGPTSTTFYTDGSWAWQMTGNAIHVTWQEAHCHDAMFGDVSDASYGLSVWLVGPVLSPGASPWQ